MKENSMLKRFLGMADKVEAEVAAASNVALEVLQAEFSAYKETAEGLLAASEAATAEATAALAKAAEAVETLEARVAVLESEKAAAQADAEAQRLATRKAKVIEAVGTARADALMAATEKLDDAAFEAVVSAVKVNGEVEAKNDLFQEVGASAEADASQVVTEESAEMKILREKYAPK